MWPQRKEFRACRARCGDTEAHLPPLLPPPLPLLLPPPLGLGEPMLLLAGLASRSPLLARSIAAAAGSAVMGWEARGLLNTLPSSSGAAATRGEAGEANIVVGDLQAGGWAAAAAAATLNLAGARPGAFMQVASVKGMHGNCLMSIFSQPALLHCVKALSFPIPTPQAAAHQRCVAGAGAAAGRFSAPRPPFLSPLRSRLGNR